MTKAEVEVGGVYRVRWHDGSFTHVRINGIKRHPVQQYNPGAGMRTIGTKTRYWGTNLKTGRTVEIKSAAKLRERVS